MDHPLEMSDEEFLNLTAPPVEVGDKTPTPPPVQEEEQEEEFEEEEETQEKADASTEEADEDLDEDSLAEDDSTDAPPVVADTPASTDKTEPENLDKNKEDESKPEDKADESTDYKALYEQVLAPFKANGKLIQPKSIDEVIQLMQMGANFTRKMQDIAPHRKTLLMLENNGLLDEQKLSFLIDLDKKNPEAIKKLVKDAGIDPLDIDTSEEPAYEQGNRHRVSDQEVNFRTVLDDLKSIPTGQETLQVINGWDQASKELLWENPTVMQMIHQQKELGIYDQISSEIERLKMVGAIPVNTPFMEAYTQVGNSLRDSGAFGAVAAQQTAPKAPQVPIATKVAAPKSKVNNSDKANAAAQSKSTARKAKPLINPLAMSDDDFMKTFANRL